jgi:hypothetical protein
MKTSTREAGAAQVGFDGGDLLLCPRCGGSYLHQGEVQVFNRQAEDQPGMRFVVNGQTVASAPVSTGFLGRRHDLRIAFWCEYCSGDSHRLWLHIKQHKGGTYIDWHWAAAPPSERCDDRPWRVPVCPLSPKAP